MPGKKIAETDVEPKYAQRIYYLKDGDLYSSPRRGKSGAKRMEESLSIRRKKGYMYFPKQDSSGMLAIYETKMARKKC